MNLYLRLLKYIRPHMLRVSAAIFCAVLATATNLYVPWIMKDVIDDVLAAKNMGSFKCHCGRYRGGVFHTRYFLFRPDFQYGICRAKGDSHIREELFSHLQRLSLSYFESRRTGAIMSYITNDVGALQGALWRVPMIYSPNLLF